jgi:lysophospholipase L1-like esterase
MSNARPLLFGAILALAGCGGSGNPFGAADAGSNPTGGNTGTGGAGGSGPGTGGTSGTGGGTMGSDAGAPGPDAGPPPGPRAACAPKRLTILGDSIPACFMVGGKMGPDCSLKTLHTSLAAKYPGLVYDNQAVSGAVSADVPARQLATVMTGPGHALVIVYVGGNDLAKYIYQLDSFAMNGFATDMPRILAAWDKVFTFFADKSKFPDGATIIVNTQYDPFDDCTAPPYNLSATKIMLLHKYNDELVKLARERGAILADQFTPFLGHGHHYAVSSCPHYQAQSAYWMSDMIHPNAAGHASLLKVWQSVLDPFYAACR